VGLANIVDLMDANSLMLTAQSSLATTRLDSHLARLSLDYATGRLKERISDLIPARDP
jgi:outer membrane protein TolC